MHFLFFQMLQYLLAKNVIDSIARDLSYDLLKDLSKTLDISLDHFQIINKTNTYIWIFDRSFLYLKSIDERIFH